MPLREGPGVAALVFLRGPGHGGGEPVLDRAVLDRVQSLLEARQERLHAELDEFEFRHFTVARFACVAAPVPVTGKGTLDGGAIARRFGSLVARLTGAFVHEPGLVPLDKEKFSRTRYVRLTSPRQGELMRLARLDKHYLRGHGDRLWYRERGRDIEVIDFVGGYGVSLLGHRHPDVVDAAAAFVAGDGVFLSDQGSARLHEGELGRKLSQMVAGATGVQCVARLGSTGAEAMEMALAHAALERDERWRKLRRDLKRTFGASHPEKVAAIVEANEKVLRNLRSKVLAVRGAFHGHTSGARGALSNAKKRAPFQPLLALDPIFLPPDGQVNLAEILAREVVELRTLVERDGRVEEATTPISRILAAVAEPILGEGGVTEVSRDLLRRLAGCDFPLILDEIQSGLGRSGELLASQGVAGGVLPVLQGAGRRRREDLRGPDRPRSLRGSLRRALLVDVRGRRLLVRGGQPRPRGDRARGRARTGA